MPDSPTSAYRTEAEPAGGGTATVAAPTTLDDRDRGVGHIRQMDPTFDELQFTATATAIFMKVQSAWHAGDVTAVRDVLTPPLATEMQTEHDHLRGQRRTNRVEQIDVDRAEVTEAWQETGQDFITVFFSATMLDYVVDERGATIDGSSSSRVRVEEFWTFTRPVGANRWKLSAIQQPT